MNRKIELRKSLAKCLPLATQACLSSLLFGGSALAAISPGSSGATGAFYTGNGELFLSVFDSTAKISYTLDLGLDQNSFFITAQQDVGSQTFIPVNDTNWTSFLSQVDPNNLRWSVLGLDQTGGTAPKGVRLFQTLKQGDVDLYRLIGKPAVGTESAVLGQNNGQFTTGTAAGQFGTFFSAVNGSGSHGVSATPSASNFAANGSSVNLDTEPGNAYYGQGSVGLSTTLNGTARYDMSNKVGESSWFYYVTRSSASDQLANVSVDEFDNLGHDGYWGFTKVGDTVDSPYKGQYLLSYTMEAHTPTAVTAAGQLRANFLDYAAGFQSRPLLNAAVGEFAGYQVTSLVVPSVSAVPEPATWGLFGLGLLGVALKARRRA